MRSFSRGQPTGNWPVRNCASGAELEARAAVSSTGCGWGQGATRRAARLQSGATARVFGRCSTAGGALVAAAREGRWCQQEADVAEGEGTLATAELVGVQQAVPCCPAGCAGQSVRQVISPASADTVVRAWQASPARSGAPRSTGSTQGEVGTGRRLPISPPVMSDAAQPGRHRRGRKPVRKLAPARRARGLRTFLSTGVGCLEGGARETAWGVSSAVGMGHAWLRCTPGRGASPGVAVATRDGRLRALSRPPGRRRAFRHRGQCSFLARCCARRHRRTRQQRRPGGGAEELPPDSTCFARLAATSAARRRPRPCRPDACCDDREHGVKQGPVCSSAVPFKEVLLASRRPAGRWRPGDGARCSK